MTVYSSNGEAGILKCLFNIVMVFTHFQTRDAFCTYRISI